MLQYYQRKSRQLRISVLLTRSEALLGFQVRAPELTRTHKCLPTVQRKWTQSWDSRPGIRRQKYHVICKYPRRYRPD